MTNKRERGMTKAEPTERFPYKAQSRQQIQNHSEPGLHHLAMAFEEEEKKKKTLSIFSQLKPRTLISNS